MKQGGAAGIQDSLRAIAKPSVVLVAILALTFCLRLRYFGQYIDADVGNVAYQAWRMAEGEILIDLEGPGKPPLYPMLYAVFIRFFGPLCPWTQDVWNDFCPRGGACGLLAGKSGLWEEGWSLGRFTLRGFLMRPDNRWWDGELGNGYAPSLYLSYRSFP